MGARARPLAPPLIQYRISFPYRFSAKYCLFGSLALGCKRMSMIQRPMPFADRRGFNRCEDISTGTCSTASLSGKPCAMQVAIAEASVQPVPWVFVVWMRGLEKSRSREVGKSETYLLKYPLPLLLPYGPLLKEQLLFQKPKALLLPPPHIR